MEGWNSGPDDGVQDAVPRKAKRPAPSCSLQGKGAHLSSLGPWTSSPPGGRAPPRALGRSSEITAKGEQGSAKDGAGLGQRAPIRPCKASPQVALCLQGPPERGCAWMNSEQ